MAEKKETTKPLLFISDRRMIELMRFTIDLGKAKNEKEYLEQIGFPPANITLIKRGSQSFTKEHIYIAAKVTNANINWLFGFEDNILRAGKPKTPRQAIREALAIVEAHLK